MGKYLLDYHMENNSTLYIVLRLHGGMMDAHQKQLDEDVELTDQPDMITWDDDPDNLRAKMPCGHAIGEFSLMTELRENCHTQSQALIIIIHVSMIYKNEI